MQPSDFAVHQDDSLPGGPLLVLLSGGIDSATAAAAVAGDFAEHRGLFVDYGQRARREEARAAAEMANWLEAPLDTVTCRLPFPSLDGEIHGRNALLLNLALAAAGRGPATILIGIHAGTGYIDCSPEFVKAMGGVFDLHTNGAVQLLAPFADLSKRDVWNIARDLKLPLDRTYSCEKADGPCKMCRSCADLEALRACA